MNTILIVAMIVLGSTSMISKADMKRVVAEGASWSYVGDAERAKVRWMKRDG